MNDRMFKYALLFIKYYTVISRKSTPTHNMTKSHKHNSEGVICTHL